MRDRSNSLIVSLKNEQGVAFLTVMMVLLLLTVMGIAGITVSALENNISGLQRTMEASANATESCLGTGANVIQQLLLPENTAQLPTSLLSSYGGPIPTSNQTILQGEIIGNPENSTDVPTGTGAVPNLVMNNQTNGGLYTFSPYTVYGDIDRLYVKMRAGSGQQQFAAYDGAGVGAGSNGVDAYYRITCIATNTATGTESKVSAIYACSLSGDGCQQQP